MQVAFGRSEADEIRPQLHKVSKICMEMLGSVLLIFLKMKFTDYLVNTRRTTVLGLKLQPWKRFASPLLSNMLQCSIVLIKTHYHHCNECFFYSMYFRPNKIVILLIINETILFLLI